MNMPKLSAGLLVFRSDPSGGLEVFLVHPGGPLWARKDEGAWSIPKGEYEAGEEPLAAARREFTEETSFEPPDPPFIALGSVQQRSGKVVHAWAAEASLDPSRLRSDSFSMEWPPGSGKQREFPEVDRGAWFSAAEAKRRIVPAQKPFIEALERLCAAGGGRPLG